MLGLDRLVGEKTLTDQGNFQLPFDAGNVKMNLREGEDIDQGKLQLPFGAGN